jgi:hypothetical protein
VHTRLVAAPLAGFVATPAAQAAEDSSASREKFCAR